MERKPLRLRALIQTEAVIKKILVALHLVPSGPRACPPSPCPTRLRRARRPLGRLSYTRRVHRRKPTGRHGAGKSTSTDRGDATRDAVA
jgi:hypothetical protein